MKVDEAIEAYDKFTNNLKKVENPIYTVYENNREEFVGNISEFKDEKKISNITAITLGLSNERFRNEFLKKNNK